MLKLHKEDDPVLKQRAEDWDFNTQSDAAVLEQDMLELMRANNAIGLAANQVGLTKRVFVMKLKNGEEIGCFNPSIVNPSEKEIAEEGCLSFPNLWIKVERDKKIFAKYLDNAGKECIIELEGIDARCFQHELDHLNGITFTQHVSPLKLQMARKKQRKLNG